MGHEERNIVTAVIANLIVNSVMILWLHRRWVAGDFAGADGLTNWARTVIWAIPGSILLTILLVILANILFAIVNRDENPDTMVDERDKAFQMRGMAVTMIAVAAGFILSLAVLALGWSALVALTMIYFSFAIGDLTGNLVKLLSYRFGG
jgi:Mn2+/Fe2+ NRAMP family transporter